MQLKSLLIFITIILLFTACEKKEQDIPLPKEQKDISNINLDETLKNYKKPYTNILCKDLLNNKKEYLPCVEKETKANPIIENLEYLAGLYILERKYDKAIKPYEEAIKQNSKKATYSLAGLYNEQIKNRVKAKELFMTILDFKDSTCQIGGILALNDNDDAFDFYEEQIEKGNNKAYICKGLLHIKEQDYYEAKESYEKLLSLGDKEAYFYLGNLYSEYLLLKGRAIDFYMKSAKEGKKTSEKAISSKHNLGVAYLRYERYDDAIYWFVKALESEDMDFPIEYKKLDTLATLVYMYRKMKDEKSMIKVLKRLQELGEVGGYTDLAIYYKKAKNYKKAEEIFNICIDKGYGDCAAGLGLMYERDLKDYKKAKEAYIIGIELGRHTAMNNLGGYYKKVEKDYDKAIYWFKKSSEFGNKSAALNLARLYERDLKDKENAKIWFKKAYDLGDRTLEKKLKKLGVL